MFLQKNLKRFLAKELSGVTPYFGSISLHHEDEPEKISLVSELTEIGIEVNSSEQTSDFHLEIMDGDFNERSDLRKRLLALKHSHSRNMRVAAILYNPYYKWLYHLANVFGVRKAKEPKNFFTTTDLHNLCKISGFEVVQFAHIYFFPFKLLGVGDWINRFLKIIPVINQLALTSVFYLRPIKVQSSKSSLSIIVAARNEEGNIWNILNEIPNFTEDIEVIFVEGNSTDNTWGRINELIKAPEFVEKFSSLKAYKQPGKGKADAVRVGFDEATKDLVTILDADLTMPAEDLPQYYEAYQQGLGDFINGNRLVYPMEKGAMKFINHVGNVFFAKTLSNILNIKIGDSLCGTKFFSRANYLRMKKWNHAFGKFDPFGDYEMIFPAAVLKLGIVDIPITYKARTYGDTNISRFKDSIQLFRMCLIGFFRIKL